MCKCKYYCDYKFAVSGLKCLKDVCNIDLAPCKGNKENCNKAKDLKGQKNDN